LISSTFEFGIVQGTRQGFGGTRSNLGGIIPGFGGGSKEVITVSGIGGGGDGGVSFLLSTVA